MRRLAVVCFVVLAAGACQQPPADTITAISNDFYNRLWRKRRSLEEKSDAADRKRQLRLAQVSSLGLGLLVTALACYVGRIGDVFTIAMKLIQGFIGLKSHF